MGNEAVAVWNLINTGGMVALLFINLWLLLKGELLPRRVYEDLTTRILDQLCQRIMDGVRSIFREEMAQRDGED